MEAPSRRIASLPTVSTMEFIFVNYPEARTVRSGGNAVGPTRQLLTINGGTHTFTLSDPQDYVPPAQRLVLAHTAPNAPAQITFTPVTALLAGKFPADVFSAAQVATSVDTFVAKLAPLGLVWDVEKDGAFGAARAWAVVASDPQSGEAWAIAALDDASLPPHQPNPGGPYGELLFTLVGELIDTVGAGRIRFHSPDTMSTPRATGFWAGLYHQPRGVTAVAPP
jgi:hypothetical protein